MKKSRNAKISDVSKLTGFSVATVSRVINDTCYVKPETKEIVLKAIEELSYQPNLSARNLRRNTSGAILVITPNMTNPYYSNIITGISETSRKYGKSTFVCSTNGDKQQELEFMEMLNQHSVDGAIILATNKDDTSLIPYIENYPIVFCSEYNPDIEVNRVSINNYQAAYEATKYLIDLGHTNISMMSSSNLYISTTDRKQGFLDACKNNGVNVEDNILYASDDYSFFSARKLAFSFLKENPHVTAMFCISDILALGAINAAKEIGLEIPKDISILGFDNLEYSQMSIPQISTISQPCYEIGVVAMERIQQLLSNQDDLSTIDILEHKLIVRGTTTKINLD